MGILESWRFAKGAAGNFKVVDARPDGGLDVYAGRDLGAFRAAGLLKKTGGLPRDLAHRHTHTVIDTRGRITYSRDYMGRVKVGRPDQVARSLRQQALAKTAVSRAEVADLRTTAATLRSTSPLGAAKLAKVSSTVSSLEARNAALAQQLSGMRGQVPGPRLAAAQASLRASMEATRTARALTEKAVRLDRIATEAASKAARAQAELVAKTARVQAELAAKTARAQAEAAAKASRQAAEVAAKTGRAAAEASSRSLRAAAEATLKTARAAAEAAAKTARAAAEAAAQAARAAAEATAKAAVATATAVAAAAAAMLGGG